PAPKFGIPFGFPFVQQENWALFKKTDDEREPPALTPGKIERAKLAVSQSGLICQTELVQQAINFARLRFGYSVKPLKQMIVEENPRHQRTILVARKVVYAFSIEDNGRNLADRDRQAPATTSIFLNHCRR